MKVAVCTKSSELGNHPGLWHLFVKPGFIQSGPFIHPRLWDWEVSMLSWRKSTKTIRPAKSPVKLRKLGWPAGRKATTNNQVIDGREGR
jgi:hypothetical protein